MTHKIFKYITLRIKLKQSNNYRFLGSEAPLHALQAGPLQVQVFSDVQEVPINAIVINLFEQYPVVVVYGQ